MPSGKDVITEARKYLGTPFHHQGRLIGIGIDCVGLLACVAKALGLSDKDNTTYSRQPDGDLLIRELDSMMDRVDPADIRVGDLLVFWFAPRTRKPQHTAFRTDRGMIHTYANVGKVVEHAFTGKWQKKLCAAYRFRGLSG